MSKIYNEDGKYDGATIKTDADIWLRCFTGLLEESIRVRDSAELADDALIEYKKRWGNEDI